MLPNEVDAILMVSRPVGILKTSLGDTRYELHCTHSPFT